VRHTDVLIAGAGPAGIATALSLARRGISSCVIERRREPLDKACGEGIAPAGVRALAALGVCTEKLRAAPFQGVRFVDGALAIEGRFATGVGLGVRRTELSRELLATATRAGIEVALGCALTGFEQSRGGIVARTSLGEFRTRMLVGADGLTSAVREWAGLALPARSRRFGVRRHYRIAPWSAWVEVHWRGNAEAYVTPVAPDELGVAILAHADGRNFEQQLAAFPELAAKLERAVAVSEARGAGPFWQRARRRVTGGVALVGDAAGYTDAVTGEGIALALRTGDSLARIFAASGSPAGYERAWWRITSEHRAFAALLGFAVAHPRTRRAAFRALAWKPDLFERLLRRATAESWTPRTEPSASRSRTIDRPERNQTIDIGKREESEPV
jgi:flavin-dependent dehydrogenase